MGTSKDSSTPTVSTEKGSLTKREVETLSPEEEGMHAGLSGETDGQ